MIALAFLWAWAGYGTTSWGWCLVRGYDIPFGAWFSPLHPYEWPADGSPPLVPKGQVWPGGGGSADGTTGTGGSGGGGSSSGGGGGKKWNIWTGYL
jgi:hypothetical protein